MKKTHKEFKALIEKTIEKYARVLLIANYTFEVHRHTEDKECLMDCSPNYPYLNARIGYSDKFFKEWQEGRDPVPVVVHEVVHCIVEPLWEKAIQRYVTKNEILAEGERLTDHITNIIIKNNL